MQIVEIRRQGESISGRMAEMRTWLRHHGMEAHLLELSFLPAKEVASASSFGTRGRRRRLSRECSTVLRGPEAIAAQATTPYLAIAQRSAPLTTKSASRAPQSGTAAAWPNR